jgi:hypothetical protein
MEWQVAGADERTGKPRRVLVAGATRADAEWQARFIGVLVSSCVPMPADDQNMLPSAELTVPAVPAVRLPYLQLKAAASRVRFWATIIAVLGIIIVMLGAILLVLGCAGGESILLLSGAMSIVNGGTLLAGAALMSLLASIGDAIRDLARKD